MTNKEIEARLQKFAKDSLIRTSYGADDDNYQQEQLRGVIAELQDVLSIYPDIGNELEKMLLVPPINEIDSTKMANIGTSATKCLQALDAGQYEKPLDHINVIVSYLSIVADQAQEICKKDAEERQHQEAIGHVVTRLLEEHFKDFEISQKRFHDDIDAARNVLEQVKQSVTNVQQLSADAEKAAAEAKKSAADAEKTANSAKAEAMAAQKSADRANKTINKANKAVDAATKDLNQAEKTADNIIPNMLTVLGIFVSIIIAVVACYLNILLMGQDKATGNHTLPVEFMRCLLMGHIMLMVVFLLLYIVSKLTSRSITSHCSKFEKKQDPQDGALKECENCKHNCNALLRFRFQYTYMFAMNILFCIGYVIFGVWHFVNVFFRSAVVEWVETHPACSAVIIGAFVICVIVTLSITFHKKKTKQPK